MSRLLPRHSPLGNGYNARNIFLAPSVRAAKLRDELSFRSFRHGGFTEGADADLTNAELRAAGRHRSARQLPTYAKRTRKQLVSVATKRRAERTKTAHLSE
jgi:hypothetical protein